MYAAADLDIAVSYNKIPKSVVKRELESTRLFPEGNWKTEQETINQPEPHHYDDGPW